MVFGAAFPLAPLLGFINNLLEMRIDKYKLVYLAKWPIPHSADSIGIWKFFIEILIYISIVTNVAYLTLTGWVFSKWVTTNLSIFAFVTLTCWTIKTFIYFVMPDMPKWLMTVLWWHENIRNKIFRQNINIEKDTEKKV